MAKTRILFDASVLGEGYDDDANKTGIYRSAYEMLRHLARIEELEIIAVASQLNFSSSRAAVGEIDPSIQFHKPSKVDWTSNLFISLRDALHSLHKTLKKLKFPGVKYLYKFNKHFAFILSSLGVNVAVIDEDLQADLYFSPFQSIPMQIRRRRKLKKAIYIHDLLPITHPQYCDSSLITTFYKIFIGGLKPDDLIFVNSESTKNDLLKVRPDFKKATIIKALLAADVMFKPQPRAELLKGIGVPTPKFFLSVSSINRRKNMDMVVDSFIEFCKKNSANDITLVLAGPKGAFFEETLSRIQHAGRYRDRIKLLGYVRDEDLIALYSLCTCYIFMSHYEGFGLTVLEAMSCGAPVIVANSSSLPEVAGGAAVLVEPNDKIMLVKAMGWMYKSEKMRSELHFKSLERAGKFSWQVCANTIASNIISRVKGDV